MDIKVHLVNDHKTYSLTLPESALASNTLMELKIPPDTVISLAITNRYRWTRSYPIMTAWN
ncbi:hypothetical protein [[Eubacterium] cellulosolvens]